ncbi:uncharacterized protein LOC125777601 [Bactrocera dorsalis]|uniref:Uncharacterized protein LOC125777601 n=1 Tax=Bactrocera dorsalis TaxID=27457 RepID=A0ABM3JHE2_BACDO|nr:uncharacterized protein LOC125777601 [Bactrocera dorsalis]
MQEYIALGHMNPVEDDCFDPTQCYYIPHHAVTGKFHVVFNASCKTTSGVSLNDTQFSGPQLQDNWIDILHRFRRYRIAITADVRKMFRQVEINPLHRKWQRILWRESPVEPLRSFELATVTYGMTSSPYNAIRSLRQCAVDNYNIVGDENRASRARNSILDGFYVDDYLESFDSLLEAVSCAHDVNTILRQGHFILDKWNSNCARALHAITDPGKSEVEIELCDSNATVLGLHWNPLSDELFFKVRIEDSHTLPTKRSILSDVARLYDPIGILAPAVVLAKMFIRTLWRKDLNWDTPLPVELQDQWLEFRNGLEELARIRVPRWLGMSPHAFCALHGFCDASSKAYAAFVGNRVAYIQAHTKVECWRHIRSEYNPADCANRGITPASLLHHPLWWTGPPSRYICIENDPVVPELTEEQLQAQTLECQPFRTLITTRQDDHQCLMTSSNGHRIPLIEKFSILSRVLNTTARLRRFLPRYKGQRSNIVTAEEYEWALLLTVKQAQGKAYRREINALKSNSRLDSRSHLLALNPYVDLESILRVGGRLRNAEISNTMSSWWHPANVTVPATTVLDNSRALASEGVHMEMYRVSETSTYSPESTNGFVTP